MTFTGVKTFVADSFRLRPFIVGVGVGLATVPLLRFVGWIV